MANRKASFTQADITRACRAMMSAGIEIGSVTVTKEGKLIICAKGYEYDADRDTSWDDFK